MSDRSPAQPLVGADDALRLLETLERRAANGHYELLGALPDTTLPDVREQARRLARQVEALRVVLPPEVLAGRFPALLGRIGLAAHVLGSAPERLVHDAWRGNFRGVAHCVAAGAPRAMVESRRRAFLSALPGREAEAQRHLTRAYVAQKLGNLDAALAELELALCADPLSLELHGLRDQVAQRIQERDRGA